MAYEELICLDEQEYIYLSEHFDVMTPYDVKTLPRYIVSSRKRNFTKLIDTAIERELEPQQRLLVIDRYFNNMNVTDIASKHSMSRQAVYRSLSAAQKKLFTALKYAYCCGFGLINIPENFEQMLTKIEKENSDENNKN